MYGNGTKFVVPATQVLQFMVPTHFWASRSEAYNFHLHDRGSDAQMFSPDGEKRVLTAPIKCLEALNKAFLATPRHLEA